MNKLEDNIVLTNLGSKRLPNLSFKDQILLLLDQSNQIQILNT